MRFSLALLVAAAVLTTSAHRSDAVVLESHFDCQKAISKAGASYMKSRIKREMECDRERFGAAPAADPCNEPDVLEDLAKLESKLGNAIAKGCGELSDGDLSNPRPEGLGATGSSDAYATVKNSIDPLIRRLVHVSHGGGGGSGGALGDEAMSCQKALDKAVVKGVIGAIKLLGTKCHDRDDAGRNVTGEVSRILSACLEVAGADLDEMTAKISGKTTPKCTPAGANEVGACDTLVLDRTPASVASCVLEGATDAAAATVASTHFRKGPRVIGRIEVSVPGHTGTYPASYGHVVAIGHDFVEIGSDDADVNGRIDIEVRPTERVTLCLQRDGVTSCSPESVFTGNGPIFFESRTVSMPLAAGTSGTVARVLRSDGSPCFEASTTPDFAVSGGVVVSPTGLPPSGTRSLVSAGGEVLLSVPDSGPHTLHADCGLEQVSVNLGSPPFAAPIDVQMTNPLPSGGTVTMTDDMGTPITDPTTVQPNSIVTLHADVPDDDALEYRWEITRGDGDFPGVSGNGRFTSGQDVAWRVGTSSGIHQVTLWAGDSEGGIESIVATLGPIDIGPVLTAPCIAPPKLQKFLCATGYDASVPEPEGGRSDFLGYKYRNASRNSADDACLYYNVVDPECIDMDCDGVVDPGSDPLGKCKRTTLGGWWQKNGFDSNGLGTDVVTAWYLNSNDLGFGREMHCRVTSWSTIIAERPVDAPTSDARMIAAMQEEIQSSPVVAQYAKLFQLYPSTVACYVTNYTTDHCFNYPTNDPQNANLAYQGQIDFVANPLVDPPNAYGTVAMEFGPVEGFGQVGAITKFFVYDGRTAAGKRLTSANLDGCGPKSVPELCMTCHGGDWPGDSGQDAQLDAIVAGLSSISGVLAGIDANDTGLTDAGYLLRKSLIAELTREEWGFSSFLPFDPDTFQFPAAASFASQAASIRKLNQLVLYTKPKDPIRDLVKGWYSNNLVSGTFAPWRPSGWNDDGFSPGDESDLHDDVYARACRVCHAAHYSFNSYGFFPPSGRICDDGAGNAGGTPTMPHAKLTYLNLWRGDFPQAPTMSTLETYYTAYEPGFVTCD